MNKNSAITIRLPAALKQQIEARARSGKRSLSAQLVYDLETLVSRSPEGKKGGRFLGLYRGSKIPTDEEIKEIRSLLWGKLAKCRERHG